MAYTIHLLVGSLVVLMSNFVDAEMSCPLFKLGDEDFADRLADKFINRCPPTLIGPASREYCCYNMKLEAHCCELGDFLLNMSVLAVVTLIILALISTVVSCICCLCCPCCCLYKRRHAGRVYRNPPASITTTSRISTEYQPIVKSHIPPGAYPVLPTTGEMIPHRSQQ